MSASKELDKVIDDRVQAALRAEKLGGKDDAFTNKNASVDELKTPLAKPRRIVTTKDQLNAGQLSAGIDGPLTETAEADRQYFAEKPFVLGLSGLFFVGAQSIKQMSFLDAQDNPLDIIFKETKFND